MPRKKSKRSPWGHPWYRVDRNTWYISLQDGTKAPLRDRDGCPVRGKNNRAGAEAVWHEMMAVSRANRAGDENLVKVVLDLFLQHSDRHSGPKTVNTYQGFFQSFLDHAPAGLLVLDMNPALIEDWWEERHPDWGTSTRNLCGSAFKAAFRWAAGPHRLIPSSPLSGWKLPTMRKRSHEVCVTQAEFDDVLGRVKSQPLRDILVVLWWTGTRPVNLMRATAANVIYDGKALKFDDTNTDPDSPAHKTFKKTGRPLLVPLPDPAREVVLRLVKTRPEGPLFRTPNGRPWRGTLLASSIAHYARQADLEGRFTAYSCRHSKATNMLEAGVSHGDVASYLGNTPAVIHRNYSHVQANIDRMRQIGGTT